MRGLMRTGWCGWWAFIRGGIGLVMHAVVYIEPVTALTGNKTVEPTTACEEFSFNNANASWTLHECVDVWSDWVATVPIELHRAYPQRELMAGVADDMRKRGRPCYVMSDSAGDGTGSSTIRHMATWMFSRELGCDWVRPIWGRDVTYEKNGNYTSLYCHSKKAEEETLESMSSRQRSSLKRCYMVSWLYYFHFDTPSVEVPEDAVPNTVITKPERSEDLEAAIKEVTEVGLDNVSWDTLILKFHPMVASKYLLAIGGWDSFKRGVVRDVLQEMRKNFHASPRPWFNPSPACSFDVRRLNFAIHVRMGDRRVIQDIPDDYFKRLEELMETITSTVLESGLAVPLFHVFTETLMPCPSSETGTFDEMPQWHVNKEEVPPCLNVEAKIDCEHKQQEGECIPDRSGIFTVLSKPIVLHVGEDVVNALSCMALADGVVMGCSTFGQLAGLLTNGISMFSTACSGLRTPGQYKMVPPIAISERGKKWVPIEGSWRDPKLTATNAWRNALHEHLKADI